MCAGNGQESLMDQIMSVFYMACPIVWTTPRQIVRIAAMITGGGLLRFLTLLSALILWATPPPAQADGKIFRPVAVADDPWIPDQRALLHWMDGEETLVIETSVNGGGAADQELAWVVPVPSLPEVEEAPAGLFPALAEAMGPKITRETPWWFPFLALPALRWWARRTPRSFAFRLMIAFLLWSVILALAWSFESRDFFFAGMTLLAAPAAILTGTLDNCVTEKGELRWSVCLAVVSFLVAALGLLGFLSFGRIMAAGGGPVSVLGVTQAGRFDVTLLRAEDPGALAGWMKENGYHLPPATRPAIEAYVREGWVFCAMKTRRSGDRSSGPLHPVAFRFKTDKPVYPMRLTASGTAGHPLALDLFVVGPETATVPGMKVKRAALTYGDGNSDYDLEETNGRARSLRWAPEEIRRWFGSAVVGTWLRGTFSMDQLTRDVVPSWTGRSLRDPEVSTLSGAVNMVMNRIVAVLLGLWIAACLHRAWIRRHNYWDVSKSLPPESRPLWCSLAILGVVWCLAWSVSLEVIPVKQRSGREAVRRRSEAMIIRWVQNQARDLMERIQDRGVDGNSIKDGERNKMIQDFLTEMNGISAKESHLEQFTVACEEGQSGTAIWYQSTAAGRVHLVTWDANGKSDLRPGRRPAWELPSYKN
jgi:hypothetical protein